MDADQVCNRCLYQLTIPSSQLHIDYPAGPEHLEKHSALARRWLPDLIPLILEAWREFWPMRLNGQIMTPPITTWHGDPVCWVHLEDLARLEQEPAVVRMAQWGPRRGGH